MRTTLLAAALLSSTAFAQNKTIDVVDDVGVGDHFPSQVPGSGPYRLPPREAIDVRGEVAEKPASEPSEWAAPPSAQPAPAVQAAPAAQVAPTPQAQPAPAPAPAAQQAPAAAPAEAPAPAIALEVEQAVLQRASNSVLQGNCETELPRLSELLDRSDRADTRGRARILRARCFTQRAKPAQAKAEYQTYLRDFPAGRWAGEARELLGEL